MSLRARRTGGGALLALLLLLGLLAGAASPGFTVATLPAAVGRAVGGALGGGSGGSGPPAAADELAGGPDIGASDAALADVPSHYLALYVTAAGACPALSWQVLAGIGKVESDHGRSSAPGVLSGINRAGCCAGPMQFNLRNGPPSTWDTFGDGVLTHVYDPAHAIPAAARKLCNDGLANPQAAARDPCPTVHGSAALHQALKRYNNACWYVHEVVTLAQRYTRTAAPTLAPSADPFVVALAHNPRITTTTSHGCDPAPDLASGRLDLRVQSLLAVLADRYAIRLSCLRSGHSRFVKGTTRVSNHTVWRAVDIDRVDGQPVSPHSRVARALVEWLDGVEGPLRPVEIGSPFDLGRRPYFTDEGHQEHIHVGYGAMLD
ncbi:MAG TPA: hypothetical protein VF880_08250 [Actinomycetes bacterium]